jgi:hypothetical protein
LSSYTLLICDAGIVRAGSQGKSLGVGGLGELGDLAFAVTLQAALELLARSRLVADFVQDVLVADEAGTLGEAGVPH